MVKSGFDECVGLTRIVMNILGIWPTAKLDDNWIAKYHFLVPLFFMVFFINIPQTEMLLLVWGNLNLILEILTTADIMIGLACFKLLGIWYNKSDLRYLLTEMTIDWKTTSTDRQQVMWDRVKLCKMILFCYTVLTYGTIVVYATRMLIILYFHVSQESYVSINISMNKPMFVTSKFFFETQSSPIFEIIWICQFVAATMGVGVFTTFDGFFIFSILHLCGQLTNLQVDLKNLIFNSRSRKQSFVQSLRLVIERHVHLYRFTNCIEDNFNKVFLIQMICYSVTICLQGYQLVISITEKTKNSASTLAFIVIFTVANIMSLFMYCFVAEKLRTESTNIFLAVYEINWYDLTPSETKMLLNILYFTKAPLRITAGRFTALSFEYFTKVLKSSAGYLSMLLAVKSSLQFEN